MKINVDFSFGGFEIRFSELLEKADSNVKAEKSVRKERGCGDCQRVAQPCSNVKRRARCAKLDKFTFGRGTSRSETPHPSVMM